MSYYQQKPDLKYPDTCNGKFLTPFQRQQLQKSLQSDLPESYRQRIQIMLLADEGKSQAEICRALGCCAATVRHWMHIARTGMAHQWRDCPLGRPKAVNEEYLERLKELVSNSPRDYGYAFRRWTVSWLQKHLAKEFGFELSDRHLKRLLKQMGLSTLSKPNITEIVSTSKIFISDLKSEDIPDNSVFLPINFTNLDQDSDTHGAKSIRPFGFSATVQQYFGLCSFSR